jgi:hypothetical protein
MPSSVRPTLEADHESDRAMSTDPDRECVLQLDSCRCFYARVELETAGRRFMLAKRESRAVQVPRAG